MGSGSISGVCPAGICSSDSYQAGINNQNWGIFSQRAGGAFTGTTSNTWNWSARWSDALIAAATSLSGGNIEGTKWSDGKIEGTSYGYGAGVTAPAPMTWISVGDVMGAYNPGNSFQMINTGVWIETVRFLNMAADTTPGGGQAKLAQLNIPAVQVGSATLTYTYTAPPPDHNFTTLSMNDVKFFSFASGQAPNLWATSSVTGSYTAAPVINTAITVAGGGLSANFTFQQWGSSNWLATVDGSGSLSGGSYTGSVNFSGAASGTFNTTPGTISGTASGVAK